MVVEITEASLCGLISLRLCVNPSSFNAKMLKEQRRQDNALNNKSRKKIRLLKTIFLLRALDEEGRLGSSMV
jgi:hypothetical protein